MERRELTPNFRLLVCRPLATNFGQIGMNLSMNREILSCLHGAWSLQPTTGPVGTVSLSYPFGSCTPG